MEQIDLAETPRFQYRGLRYFAHRSLHRFQAEHWGYEDWKKEINWILKKRLNLFMLRIGPALCRATGMSDTYLRKLFLQYFETTPIKYINRLRINHAKELISSDYYSIEEVAADAGFEDPKYFSSVFRKLEGCSPVEYKKSWWKR